MNFLTYGRRNVVGADRSNGPGYAMVPLGNSAHDNEDSGSNDDDIRNRHNPRTNDEEEDDEEGDDGDDAVNEVGGVNMNTLGRGTNGMEQEQARRQQILRLGLMICLIFFLLDGNSYANAPNEVRGNSSKRIDQPLDAIRLSNRDLFDTKTVLLPLRTADFTKQNATGMFKGSWKTFVPENPLGDNSTDINKHREEEGSLMMTLKSVPIDDLPDLSFVYGIARMYDRQLQLLPHLSFPLQGIVLTAEEKVLLFSTPYKTQKLMMQYHLPAAPPPPSPMTPTMYSEDTGQAPNALNTLISNDHSNVGGTFRGQKITDTPSITSSGSHFELITTASEGQAYRIRSSSTGTAGGDSAPISTSYPELKFFLWDSALTPYNTSAWDASPSANSENDNGPNRSVALTHTIALGEEQLSARFKFYQVSRPNMNLPAPSAKTATTAAATAIASTFSPYSSHAMLSSFVSSLFSSHKHSTLTSSAAASAVEWRVQVGDETDTVKDKGKDKDKDREASPTKNRLVSPAQLASDCLFALELSLGNDNKHNTNDNDNEKDGNKKNDVKDYVERTNLVTSMHLLDGNRDDRRQLLFTASELPVDAVISSSGTATMETGAEAAVEEAGQEMEVSLLAKMRVMWNAVQDHQNLMLLTSSSTSSTSSTSPTPSVSSSSNAPPASAVAGLHSLSTSSSSSASIEAEGEGKSKDVVQHSQQKGQKEEMWQVARRLATKLIPPVNNLHGVVHSFYSCTQRAFSLSVASYELQFDALKNKVEIYSLLYTALCLIQVFCVVYQLKLTNLAPALAMKTSITAVLAQSLLDAVICMGHLLLGAGISNLFFANFLWISVLKLLLFSVFQMRLVINAYQARYAQELAGEGWRGFRARLVTMHLRFYGIVLFVLLFAFSLPVHPFLAILALYSFWWPQIIHNTLQGTKHIFHPAYLYGSSLTRLFLPLYLMGCPENFLVKLWQYFSPSGQLSPSSQLLSPSACIFLVVWLAVQVGILHLQTAFGPRFFVPKRFLPQRYDYHRPLPAHVCHQLSHVQRVEVDVLQSYADTSAPTSSDISSNSSGIRGHVDAHHGSGLSGLGAFISSAASSLLSGGGGGGGGGLGHSSGRGGSGVADEVSSLLGDIETGPLHSSSVGGGSHHGNSSSSASYHADAVSSTAVASAADSTDGDVNNSSSTSSANNGLECVICYNSLQFPHRTAYMIAPCDHVFHTECLQTWLRVKLECPVCRATCPALDEDNQQS